MAIINVQYTEYSKAKNLGYKSVSVSYDNLKKRKFFKSKNFVKDWYDAIKFCIQEISENEHVSVSSDVDHFIMDGAKKLYDSAYLIPDKTPKLAYYYIDGAIEFFVPKATTPTWQELKDMCEKKKKLKNE